MLEQVAQEMNIDLSQSYMVGDAITDLMAAERVGCQSFLVLSGRGFQQLVPALHTVNKEFTITRNLIGATTHILKAELKLAYQEEKIKHLGSIQQFWKQRPIISG